MMVDRFDPPRDLDWKPLPMRPDIAGQYVRYSDLEAARAEIERLNNALTEAVNQISDLAARLGQAEGRLDASELVGVVEGWKARAEKAEDEVERLRGVLRKRTEEADRADERADKAEAERDGLLEHCKLEEARGDKLKTERDKARAEINEYRGAAMQAAIERDEARAQIAAVIEQAADKAFNFGQGAPYNQRASITALAASIRALTPADAKAALEAYGREKVREGVKRAASLFKDANHGKHIMDAILAEMETLK
ncbi:hypothetical protein LOS78_05745 [Paracoccus sp. MA]|uniref:hypothetical protein n=1 Tax=Paracoccus sp. MA TaxID=2895796 RepID=UPI001E441990|nr:hypothetical protein [Paracoccus sp. MA]UFM63668.1 hypothetical protein LOS78_05745 [Paracoccus sp. MA]